MKVSIITATYNSEKTLLDTLLSVESQTYPDIEYIIVDSVSTDGTLDLVRKNSSRVTKIVSEKDKGIYDALNKGVEMATGDIVGFIHSDDILARSDIIEKIVDEFKCSGADFVYGDLVFTDRNITSRVKRYWRSGEFRKTKISFGWAPPHPSVYMKKQVYQNDGLFDLNFKIAADYDQMIRILKRDDIKVSYLNQVIVKMRLGGESTKIENTVSSTREIISVMKKHKINWRFAILYRKLVKSLQLFLKP